MSGTSDLPTLKPMTRDPLRLVTGPEETYPGCDYSDDERQFLAAIDRYKRERRRPYPTWREVLHVVRGLGYRKATDIEGGVQ